MLGRAIMMASHVMMLFMLRSKKLVLLYLAESLGCALFDCAPMGILGLLKGRSIAHPGCTKFPIHPSQIS